jgi:hypothetical protein
MVAARYPFAPGREEIAMSKSPLAPSRRVLWIVPLAFAAVALAAATLVTAQQRSDVEKKETLAEFMSRKLEHSQAVLGALSRVDLAAVGEHADKLGLLCIDLNWNVIQSDEYVERSTTFRRTIAALAKAARAEQLPRAELAYLDLVGQCFSCHEFVRDRKLVK